MSVEDVMAAMKVVLMVLVGRLEERRVEARCVSKWEGERGKSVKERGGGRGGREKGGR